MEPVYYPEEETYRMYCPICDNLCIDRCYQNHSKSQSNSNKLKKKYLTIK